MMQESINKYLLRVLIFLVLVVLVTIYVYPVIQSAFLSNIYINSIIVLSLLFGLSFCLYNISEIDTNSIQVYLNDQIYQTP